MKALSNTPSTTKTDLATDVITHDVSPLTVHTDTSGYGKLGWLIVLVGVGGFLLWALLAPLDKGVPMPGTVAKEGNRKAVQYQPGGTVREILARDGDIVKAGQVVARMSDVVAKSQLEIARVQYYTARSAEARLTAERDGKAIVFPEELNAYSGDPRAKEAFEGQKQLMSARQGSLKNELAAVDENIAGLKAQTAGLIESRDSKKQQLAFLKEQLAGMRDLSKDGYVARNRLLDLERTYAQISGAISEDIGNISRGQRQVMELTLRRIQRIEDYQKEVRTQLSDASKEAEATAGRIKALDYDVANTDVKSPVAGIVVGSTVFTEGGVVAPGAHLMDVVPVEDGLVVEGQLAVNLVDRVHPNLPVELMFSAFNTNRTPHIPGVVEQVAADRTVDERNGTASYKVRVKVTPEGARMIAQHKLDIRPGMPVEVFVKTGERTMMSYLMKPVIDRANSSLTED
ncbi:MULTISPECIES: HlyD family type I secretion periplasmic adaptor subunit [unclassified Duganella]|uniref:HlyD family type I secretion periplasmic adaptor subunit n=1 Tax=unclassified Duganella TaxID=2636909 RepID=UPI000884B955|nr:MULTISPECIES: HlyD family type I secretion periplasmic adaptor subunit [unclassified Duganella]SDF93498.1 membrane fusion protein, protease secretion system [Duganella sp. OV458]SDJ11329.1 membrane fusion protein, protease secretion system [Duganella sp. OV510]